MKRKIIVALIGAGIVVGLVMALWPAPVPVSAVSAERNHFTEYVEEEGRTDLRDPYTMTAPIGGYLRRITLEVGDDVSAGDVLFELEAIPAPALDLRTRQQAREAAGAARARMDAAEAELEARASEARWAGKEYERGESLHEQGHISLAEMDRLRTGRDRAVSAERAARNTLETASYEWRNAQAVLDIEEGRRVPKDAPVLRVRAPITGNVLARHRRDEGPVQAGEPLLGLGDLSQLEVRVDLLSMDAVRVEEGMKVVLMRWGGDRDLAARVRRVEPSGFMRVSALGVEEQRVPVLVVLDAPREDWARLGKGYRVEARFILWEGDDVLQIPVSALFRHEDEWAVFVVEDGRAVRRRIEPGRRSGLWTQVLSGLEAGETVIIHPGDRIEDGVRVEVEMRPYR